MKQTTKNQALRIEGGKERILKVKPKGGECRNKLRKHLIFIVSEILLFLVTTSELVSTSPPFGVALSPARERKMHLASEKKKTSHKAQF